MNSSANEFGRDVLVVAGAAVLMIAAVMGSVHFQNERRIRLATDAFQKKADGLPVIYQNAADAAKRHDVTNFNKSLGLAMESEIEMRDISDNMTRHAADDTLKRVALCINRLGFLKNSLNGPSAAKMRELDPHISQQVDDCISGRNL